MEESNQLEQIFIGARDLKGEVYKVLPNFELLVEQIENMRPKNEIKNDHIEYRKNVNNTLAIFGARGTGKSSVLYTLINRLEDELNIVSENILLPIIEPDHFGENTKITGSIVGFLNKAAYEQLEKIKDAYAKNTKKSELFDDYFDQGNYKKNNKLKLKIDEVIEYHMYTANEYRKLLVHNYDDLATHIKKSSHLLISDVEFKQKLYELINLLIQNQRLLLNVLKSDNEKEPLIFIIIDDIDLKMTRSKELIEALLQYTNHPNVVTILSGDYDILQESIMLALIQDEKLPSSNLDVDFKFKTLNAHGDQNSIHERKDYLSHEYLKKIIPPARRFQLVRWNEKTVPNFSMNGLTLIALLQGIFGENNLFSYKKRDVLIPINSSYIIFDNTPRGIINVYYHLSQLRTNLISGDSKFFHVKSLVDTIIHSSTMLMKNQSFIFNDFLKWGSDEESTFINYSSFQNKYDQLMLLINFGNSDQSELEELLNVNRALYIIGSIVTELLPKVNYNRDDRKLWWNHVTDKLFKSISVEGTRISYNQVDKNNANYFSQVIRLLLNNMDESEAFVLINELDPYKSWLLQLNGTMSMHEYEIREREIIITLNEFLDRVDYKILKNLYLKLYSMAKQNNNSARGISLVLQFFNDAIVKDAEETYYKTLYFSNGFSELLINNIKSDMNFSEIRVEILAEEQSDLLLNLLVKLIIILEREKVNENVNENYEEIDYEDLEQEGSAYEKFKNNASLQAVKLNKSINSIKKKGLLQKLNLNQLNAMNGQIEKFKVNLESKLSKYDDIYSLRISVKITSELQKELYAFMNGYSGVSRTIYENTRVEFSSIFNFQTIISSQSNVTTFDFSQFIQIRQLLKKLANNYLVWYGKKEAQGLLKVLDKCSYLSPDNLLVAQLDTLIVIKEYLEHTIDAVHTDERFEKARNELEKHMVSALNLAMESTEKDLQEIGIDLSEDEKEVDDEEDEID